jgi:hypothetical protein
MSDENPGDKMWRQIKRAHINFGNWAAHIGEGPAKNSAKADMFASIIARNVAETGEFKTPYSRETAVNKALHVASTVWDGYHLNGAGPQLLALTVARLAEEEAKIAESKTR